jgi:hypothetical protein
MAASRDSSLLVALRQSGRLTQRLRSAIWDNRIHNGVLPNADDAAPDDAPPSAPVAATAAAADIPVRNSHHSNRRAEPPHVRQANYPREQLFRR